MLLVWLFIYFKQDFTHPLIAGALVSVALLLEGASVLEVMKVLGKRVVGLTKGTVKFGVTGIRTNFNP